MKISAVLIALLADAAAARDVFAPKLRGLDFEELSAQCNCDSWQDCAAGEYCDCSASCNDHGNGSGRCKTGDVNAAPCDGGGIGYLCDCEDDGDCASGYRCSFGTSCDVPGNANWNTGECVYNGGGGNNRDGRDACKKKNDVGCNDPDYPICCKNTGPWYVLLPCRYSCSTS